MNLKRNFAAALLLCAAAVPALAAVSISVGEPGFFGTIDLGGGPPPQVINAQPVIIGPPVVNAPPVYLRVPVAQQHDWRRYCGQYNACGRPAYFVHEAGIAATTPATRRCAAKSMRATSAAKTSGARRQRSNGLADWPVGQPALRASTFGDVPHGASPNVVHLNRSSRTVLPELFFPNRSSRTVRPEPFVLNRSS